MQGIDTSQVTEEEFMALLDEDGQLREQKDEGEETPEADEEESETEQETEDSEETEEEEPKGDEDSEIKLETLDPKVRAFVEKFQSDAKRWQTDYGKIQSQWTKASQSQKEFESTRARLEQRDQQLAQIEDLLEKNPRLLELIDKELDKSPLDGEVPDYLRQDPAFQYMQQTLRPYVQSLEKQLQDTMKKASRFDEFEKQQQQAKHRQELEAQIAAAGEQIKSIFGRDATEEEKRAVLQYMVDHKFYGNGKTAALAVFGDQYEKAVIQRHQEQMKEKAKKFPARTKSVSSSRVVPKEASTAEEAIQKALAEQGY